jgi:hypothetical protein
LRTHFATSIADVSNISPRVHEIPRSSDHKDTPGVVFATNVSFVPKKQNAVSDFGDITLIHS